MGMILRIASSRIVGQGDIVGRSGYFSLNLSANSVMRGRLDARRTLKSLVADLRADKLLLHIECNSVKPLLAEELEDVHTFMDMFEKEIHLITDMVVDNENLKGDTLIVRLLATNLALT